MICRVCGKEYECQRKRTRCNSCNTKIRRHRTKLAAIKYLGGKCNRCGYNKHTAALEFHHKNITEKDFNIGNVANKSWLLIKKELDKCELLCSNCHRIEHSNRDETEFLAEVQNYKGKLLE